MGVRFIGKRTVVLLLAVAIIIILVFSAAQGKYQFPLVERIVVTVFSPVEYVMAKSSYGIRNVTSMIGGVFNAYSDNERLRTEITELKNNQLNVAEALAENERLRLMLDYKKGASQFDLVAAAVIARDPSTWTNMILIDKGSSQGLRKDMPVVTPQGLVGMVVQVYTSSARVQLLLDPRSAVGILVQRPESRVAAIVEGNATNPATPRMINIARDADVIKGDRVVTSGFGGIYPKGLLVGEVLDVANEEGGLLKYGILKPAVDFERLEEVFVIVNSREPLPLPLAPDGSAVTNPASSPKGR